MHWVIKISTANEKKWSIIAFSKFFVKNLRSHFCVCLFLRN